MIRLTRAVPTLIGLLTALALAAGCRTGTPARASGVVQLPASAGRYHPARDLGPLFQDVQLSAIFPDSKTFVDARPLLAPREIVARYTASTGMKVGRGMLRDFVSENFDLPRPVGADFRTDTSQTMEQ